MKTKASVRGENCIIYDIYLGKMGLTCSCYFPGLLPIRLEVPAVWVDLEVVNE